MYINLYLNIKLWCSQWIKINLLGFFWLTGYTWRMQQDDLIYYSSESSHRHCATVSDSWYWENLGPDHNIKNTKFQNKTMWISAPMLKKRNTLPLYSKLNYIWNCIMLKWKQNGIKLFYINWNKWNIIPRINFRVYLTKTNGNVF